MVSDRNIVPIISIIVPVYNAEAYLSDCIDSILSQSLAAFEILLIDDGSTDKSGNIIGKYAKIDNRIRTFAKENGGVSSARNVGLENAKGKWITFVDADDILQPDALLHLVSLVGTSETDLGIAGYDCINELMEVISSSLDNKESVKVVSKDNGITLLYENRFWQWFICSKIFKSAIIKHGNIKFDENVFFGEDRLFIMKYVCAMQGEIIFSSEPIYRYRIHKNSVEGISSVHFNERVFSGFNASVMMYMSLMKCDTLLYNKYLGRVDIISSYRTLKHMIKKFTIGDEQKKLLSKLNTLLYKSIPIYKYFIILIFRFFQVKIPFVDAALHKLLSRI